jgi:hypothetical protein
MSKSPYEGAKGRQEKNGEDEPIPDLIHTYIHT